jgi:hypothetical protein
VQILRFPSLTEDQFRGCVAAFVDSLSGEFNAATVALRRLEGQAKGSAFVHEIALDQHRYGALIVLDRWTALVSGFGPHLAETRCAALVETAAERTRAAENILLAANALLDEADRYNGAMTDACRAAFDSVMSLFSAESADADQAAKLGPMLAADYKEGRRVFLEDLAAR